LSVAKMEIESYLALTPSFMKKAFVTLSFLLPLYLTVRCQTTVIAGFTVPSTVCVGSPLTVQNTTTGGTNYFWSFCAADFSQTPQAVNLGNPSSALNAPVFGSYVQDNSGNFYGLVDDYAIGHVTLLSFGKSLLNTPTGVDLGGFSGVIPEQVEGIQLEQVNGNWTAVIVGGGNQFPNSSPRVVKLDFGTSLTNTPTATNWGNVGGLNLPHDFFITQENGIYYGLTTNVNDNTITRLVFGPDFTQPPTGVNLGNIGGIDYPAGLDFVNYNQNLYVFVTDRDENALTRLDFGNSITNTPTGVNIGDPGYLSYPRDISLFTTCTGIYGFVTNETSNELVQLDFGSDPTSTPTATDLGNIGNLDFPHSISNFFRVGNDIYAFIHNVDNNTLTRLRFAGCSNIPGSSLQNPPPITYPSPGVYTINLLVDLGLPTQTSYCQQVTVNPAPAGKFVADTVCYGSSPAILFNAEGGTAPFGIGYTDGQNVFSQSNLNGQSAIALPYPLTNPGSTTFTLQTVTDANGCSSTIDTSSTVLINPLPQGSISGNTACAEDSAKVLFEGTGAVLLDIVLSGGGSTVNQPGFPDTGYVILAPLPATTTYSLVSLTDNNGCTRTSGFISPTVTLVLYPSPQLTFDSLQPVCNNKDPFLITSAAEISGLTGTGIYSGAGIDSAGNFSPGLAGPGEHILTYTFSTAKCTDSISGGILVNPVPTAQPATSITICGGNHVQLEASGGDTYNWLPAGNLLSNAAIPNPVATVDSTVSFIATVSTDNGCIAYDTVTVNAPINSKTLFILPNAFTPNGDGHNDCFGIQYWAAGVTIEELDIFDRWGGKIFSTRNPSDCWGGTFNGHPEPSGGYVYVVKASSPCGEIVRTGMVMLVR
jgi:gliding motility-associated-like protein